MAIINLVTGNNRTVQPIDDALMHHLTKGSKMEVAGGVIKGYAKEFEFSISARKLKVSAGAGLLYGRLFRVEVGNEAIFDLTGLPAVYNIFCTVYVEINLSSPTAPTAIMQIATNTTSFPIVSLGDDLFVNESGIARIIIGTLIYNGQTGAISEVHYDAPKLESDRIAHANEADSLPGTGKINGRSVGAIIDSSSNRVKDAQKIAGNTITDDWTVCADSTNAGASLKMIGALEQNFGTVTFSGEPVSIGTYKVYSDQNAADIYSVNLAVRTFREGSTAVGVSYYSVPLNKFNDSILRGRLFVPANTTTSLGYIDFEYNPSTGQLRVSNVYAPSGASSWSLNGLEIRACFIMRLRRHVA